MAHRAILTQEVGAIFYGRAGAERSDGRHGHRRRVLGAGRRSRSAAALGVVVVRNLIHAVVFLILSFIGVAGLYITLSADFVAVAQILIYAGAVSVLLLFAIVLTPSGRARQPGELPAAAGAAAGAARGVHARLCRDRHELGDLGPGGLRGDGVGDRRSAARQVRAAVRDRVGAAASGDDRRDRAGAAGGRDGGRRSSVRRPRALPDPRRAAVLHRAVPGAGEAELRSAC